jgi:hypothetical protein
MMNMRFRVWSHILVTLGFGEDKAWEYNQKDHILIVDLHKLIVLIHYDDEEQMSSILAHIHMGVVNHLIIHAYVGSCTRNAYDHNTLSPCRHKMTCS